MMKMAEASLKRFPTLYYKRTYYISYSLYITSGRIILVIHSDQVTFINEEALGRLNNSLVDKFWKA